MPRRIPDYPDAFFGWNLISSYGSIISIISSFLFIYIIYNILVSESNVEANVWYTPDFFSSFYTNTAYTLEWSVSSPPAFHCFNQLPILSSSRIFIYVNKNIRINEVYLKLNPFLSL